MNEHRKDGYMKFRKLNVSRLFDRGYKSGRGRDDATLCNSSSGNTGGCGCNRSKLDSLYEKKNDTSSGCGAGGCHSGSCIDNSVRGEENKHGCGCRGCDYGSQNQTVSSKPPCSDAIRDRGNEPIVFDIRKEAFMNSDFRTSLWTGANIQLTVMTIPVGEETGIERHEGIDQLVGVVSGAGEVLFGNRENYFATPVPLDAHSVILIPAGTYHNIRNVGRTPLKLYSVYAPKAHKFGTVDMSKTD